MMLPIWFKAQHSEGEAILLKWYVSISLLDVYKHAQVVETII